LKDYDDLLISVCKCSSEPNEAQSVNSDQQEQETDQQEQESDQQELRRRTAMYFTKLFEFIFE